MTSFKDWVVETSSTTGTGSYSLSGSAPAGTSYFTFRQRYANGDDEVVYWVTNSDATKWERNRFATLTYGSPDTLTRNVIESTNGDAPVFWVGGDGPLLIYVVPDAEAQEFAISMGFGAARPGVLKFGLWADEDDVASGIHTLKLFDGTNDIPFGSVNVAANKFIPAPTAINFPPGHIHGLTYGNSAGDPTNDIDIFAGGCEDSTGVYPLVLASTLTKRLDAAWAVGSGNGGLDTGSIANADYYIHIIARSDTGVVDALFSLSATAPTMPANYDYFRPFGFVRRNGGSLQVFNTYELPGGGLELKWKIVTLDVDLLNTLTTSRRTDALRVPLNFSVEAIVRWFVFDATSTVLALLSCPDETDAAPSSNSIPGFNTRTVDTNDAHVYEQIVRTSATGTVAARSTLALVDTYRIFTVGFKWSRR